jgi:hypothetical protein
MKIRKQIAVGVGIAGWFAIGSGCVGGLSANGPFRRLEIVQRDLIREERRLLRIRTEILKQRLRLVRAQHAAEIAEWRARAARWPAERARLQSKVAVQRGRRLRSAASAAEREPECGSRRGYGILRVNTKPWTRIYVDGRYMGLTPEADIRLEAGRHTLRLVNPEYGISKTYRIAIDACASKTFVRKLTQEGWGHGTLRINTKPWTRIYVDGRYLGLTPEDDIRLEAGRHTLRLVNPEFGISKTYTISIIGGTSKTFVRKLTR